MRRIFRTLCFHTAIWTCIVLTTLPAQSQPEANPQVLILNSFDEGTAPFFEARNVFMTELQRLYPATIAFRQFDLGERGQDDDSSHELKAQLLHGQYANGPPDLVLALGPPALTFWLQHRDSVFGHTPVIAGVGEYALYQAQLRPGDAVVAPHFSFPELVENILTLAPGTSRILMVFGPSALERGQSELAKKQLEAYSGRVAFEYTNDFSVADLQRRLSSLPEGSAVLYGVFDSDVNAVTLSGHSLALVRAASRAPVFGSFDDQLGLGIVGGRLIQIAPAGRELARIADAILRDAGPPDPLTVVGIGEPVYDWRELRAWSIDLDRLPPGSDPLAMVHDILHGLKPLDFLTPDRFPPVGRENGGLFLLDMEKVRNHRHPCAGFAVVVRDSQVSGAPEGEQRVVSDEWAGFNFPLERS